MIAAKGGGREKAEGTLLRLFQQARKDPLAAYERDRFLAYLTEPPASQGRRVADTFAGRARFVRFMQEVQLEFGVCFTNAEWDGGLPMDGFVDLVCRKSEKPKVALRLARERLRNAWSHVWGSPTKWGLILLPLLVLAVLGRSTPLGIASGLLFLGVEATVVILTVKEVAHYRKLVGRLSGRGEV